jgi:uracil DNA glycosylase
VLQWNVIVFGQSPYPRRESAVGIGCCDGAVRLWAQKLSPTLRNVIKVAYALPLRLSWRLFLVLLN